MTQRGDDHPSGAFAKGEDLFRNLAQALKPYLFPWGTFTPKVPLQQLLEELGVSHQSLPQEAGPTALSTYASGSLEFWLHPRAHRRPWVSRNSQLHELYHAVASGGQGLHSEERRHAKETLASRFATDMLRPLPVISLFAAERSADWSLAYLTPQLEELMRVTSRQIFVFEYEGTKDGLARQDVIGENPRVIVRAPDDVFDTVEQLKSIATESDSSGTHHASFVPPGHKSSYFTQDGFYYDFNGGELGRWLEENDLLPEVSPRDDWMRIAAREIREPFILGESNQIASGPYFIVYLPVGSVTMPTATATPNKEIFARGLAVRDEDDSLARAWREADSRGGMGPLLPWRDPLRYHQPESYEEWTEVIWETYLAGP